MTVLRKSLTVGLVAAVVALFGAFSVTANSPDEGAPPRDAPPPRVFDEEKGEFIPTQETYKVRGPKGEVTEIPAEEMKRLWNHPEKVNPCEVLPRHAIKSDKACENMRLPDPPPGPPGQEGRSPSKGRD